MKLSTKGRYAVTALADIAMHGRSGPVPLGEIAERQDISLAYLEQLFVKLRRAGLVDSVRGPGGGYLLAKQPRDTRISDVMAAVDERLNAMGCNGRYDEGKGCGKSHEACLTHGLWEQLSAHVHVFLNSKSIADITEGRVEPCRAVPAFIEFIDEAEVLTP
ncbi:MAG: Rrf2 family transcriptional regulator [Pseudomonadota bacterium]